MARGAGAAISETRGSSNVLALLGFGAVIAALYFARSILIPLALAFLFTFVLTPLVERLQALKLGRALSVLLAVFLTLTIIVGVGWIGSVQLVELASQLPQYKDNIHHKLEGFQVQKAGSKSGVVGKLSSSLQQIGDLFSEPEARATARSPKQVVMPVRVVEPARNLVQYARDLVGPLLKPLETAAIVIIFTVFMLFERESLRNRLLRLVGQEQLSLATKALGDAAERVSRFLLMQLVVNCSFGLILGVGLWAIGVPNALLFGVMGALLRFIPYVGTLAAIVMPLLLTLAVFDTWTPLLLTIALFVVLEVTLANVVEPWLYGAHTGISSLAILVAAVFWASLWGPVGLILSTPLTVCLVVLGRHVPHLQFLDILLGDEPVLLPAERFYQRLLALDVDEARSIIQAGVKTSPLVQVYDEIIVPALSMAEQDRYRSELRDASLEFICQSTGEIVREVGGLQAEAPVLRSPGRRIICFGASDAADEVTAAMLAQLLERAGFIALGFSLSPPPVSIIEQLSSDDSTDIVCICALPPLAAMHARSLAKELRTRFPALTVVVCLWATPEGQTERTEKLVGEKILGTLAAAIEEVANLSAGDLASPKPADAVA
ncbi:MAG: AI-2E family transporter [Acidobacteriota bacterium]|nr:AI-2E family transporter [Acidobacteriota bacterium]